jgi:hypothetical protein
LPQVGPVLLPEMFRILTSDSVKYYYWGVVYITN